MDKIVIKRLEIFAKHGVYDFEKENGQLFYIDAVIYFDTSLLSDNIENTIDYGSVCRDIANFLTENRFDLIEYAANLLCKLLLNKYEKICSIELTVNKPDAPIDIPFENVSATICRGRHTAYIAFGSNLGDRLGYFNKAIAALKTDCNIRFIKASSFIETEPYGVTDQPRFLNGVVKIKTIYSPEELLDFCKSLEKAAGRKTEKRWGARTFDADIIMYDNEIIFSDRLIIPHPEMHIRDFVLKPLAEIEPYLVHPVKQKNVTELLEELDKLNR